LVEHEIKEANDKASAAPNVEERNHWWKKEEQLKERGATAEERGATAEERGATARRKNHFVEASRW
jgi:hypothetical protein